VVQHAARHVLQAGDLPVLEEFMANGWQSSILLAGQVSSSRNRSLFVISVIFYYPGAGNPIH
jgi:hypothetical protein